MTTKASARETQPLAIVPAIDEYLAWRVAPAGAGGLMMDYFRVRTSVLLRRLLSVGGRGHPVSRLAPPRLSCSESPWDPRLAGLGELIGRAVKSDRRGADRPQLEGRRNTTGAAAFLAHLPG